SSGQQRGRVQRAGGRVQREGGLAVVFRYELDVKVHRLQPSILWTMFERQLVSIRSGKTPGVVVANLYRQPTSSTAPLKFYDELADLISVVTTSSSQDVVVYAAT